MNRRFNWVVGLIVLTGAAAIGVASYDAGVGHGLALAAGSSGEGVRGLVPYGYYRPWGVGLFPPLFFLFFWFLVARIFLFGGWHRRRWIDGGPYGPGQAFDDWHRQAHERMAARPAPPQQP